MHAKRSNIRVKDPAVSLVDYGNPKITQHAVKNVVFKMLKLDRRQKRTKLHFSKHKNKNVLISSEIHHRIYI